MRQRVEHTLYNNPVGESTLDLLLRLEKDGWELCGVWSFPQGSGTLFFKRPLRRFWFWA